MAKNKGDSYSPPTRAEIEAMRAEKMQLVPNGEAGRRERKLLEHYSAAQADLQWIVDNNAWHELGFDTFTGWYAARVRPAVAAAGLRPTQEFALYVLENVQSDEARLPKQQRLLQRELADLVGVSVSTLRRLSQDPPHASNGSGSDLDKDPAAVPAGNTEDASPALGEPDVDVEAASTSGTQTAADAIGTAADAGDPSSTSVPAAPAGESVPGSPSGVSQELQDGIEEEAASPRERIPLPVYCHDCKSIDERCEQHRDSSAATFSSTAAFRLISPAADTSDTESQVVLQQSGPDSPTGREGGRSETDFPVGPDHPVATAVLPGIDHHMSAGVSDSGVAPAIAVEPVLEGGGLAPDLPSSSDPEPHPGDRLLHALGVLVHLIDELDPEALGPYLFPGEVELLHLHADRIAEFVGRVGLARSGLVHTP